MIVDLFKSVIEALTQTISINSVDVSGNTYKFNVSKTYWARPSILNKSRATKVTIDSVVYDIESVVYNTSISVTTTDDLSNAESLTIAAPIYINGTYNAVNDTRSKANKTYDNCPFVWLVEPFVADERKDRLSIIQSQPDLTLLFLDNANSRDWTTDDHYSNVIQPMDELVEAFYQKILKTRASFGRISNWRVVRHAKFGKQSDFSHINSIINENTSGIEVRLTIEILKNLSCNN